MDLIRHPVGKWTLVTLYLGLFVWLVLLLPSPWQWALLGLYLPYLGWANLTQEESVGRMVELRPLTPWDVPEEPGFPERLRDLCDHLDVAEPWWAVVETPFPHLFAVGGRRGMVVFSTGLLRLLSAEELLALTAGELFHLRRQESLPGVLGGAWMRLLTVPIGMLYGGFSAYVDPLEPGTTFVRRADRAVPGLLGLAAMALEVPVAILSWAGRQVMTRRYRSDWFAADGTAAALVSPESLGRALQRLERGRAVSTGVRYRFPLWSPAWVALELQKGGPSVAERLAALGVAAEGGMARDAG